MAAGEANYPDESSRGRIFTDRIRGSKKRPCPDDTGI
jgi:hypothetical protein